MYYNPDQFPFADALQGNWRAIYEEFLGIQGDLIEWHEKKLYGRGWDVFGLYQFPHGETIGPNVRRCPLTSSLVQGLVPRHGAVGFSVLRPVTRIRPHEGYPGEFLRCHLALKVPEGDCALRVNEETRKWVEGKVLVFDDRVTHEAWNLTNEQRVVLLFDFVPEGLAAP